MQFSDLNVGNYQVILKKFPKSTATPEMLKIYENFTLSDYKELRKERFQEFMVSNESYFWGVS